MRPGGGAADIDGKKKDSEKGHGEVGANLPHRLVSFHLGTEGEQELQGEIA